MFLFCRYHPVMTNRTFLTCRPLLVWVSGHFSEAKVKRSSMIHYTTICFAVCYSRCPFDSLFLVTLSWSNIIYTEIYFYQTCISAINSLQRFNIFFSMVKFNIQLKVFICFSRRVSSKPHLCSSVERFLFEHSSSSLPLCIFYVWHRLFSRPCVGQIKVQKYS